MTMSSVTHATPFEHNIWEQPDALRRLAAGGVLDLDPLTRRKWGRIVLTGMGSSHFAGLSIWRQLVALGHDAWAIDTGQLLDNPALVDPDTLLIVTSQSGASGEVVELVEDRDTGLIRPALLVGIANDDDSPLARKADVFLPLQSGDEATVSTKSYLNTLAVHRMIETAFRGEDLQRVLAVDLPDAADAVQAVIDRTDLAGLARSTATHPERRLVYIGARGSAGTALFSALITKESAKIAAEGYVGGQFRHGPYELAGDGLTAVIFAAERRPQDESLRRLAADLTVTGSQVIMVGDPDSAADVHAAVSGATDLAFTAASSVVAELFAVDLARANGVTPGAFVHGSKITTTV